MDCDDLTLLLLSHAGIMRMKLGHRLGPQDLKDYGVGVWGLAAHLGQKVGPGPAYGEGLAERRRASFAR